jgi:Kef-type K+ transport system membrane component KefB
MLFFAWLAHEVGAPELLGGFRAGLALSRRFYLPFGKFLAGDSNSAHEIDSQMNPIIRLFTPIFFLQFMFQHDKQFVGNNFVFIQFS